MTASEVMGEACAAVCSFCRAGEPVEHRGTVGYVHHLGNLAHISREVFEAPCRASEIRCAIGPLADATDLILAEVRRERERQDLKWGQQNHPDGTGGQFKSAHVRFIREACERAFAEGRGTWWHVLQEEVAEAFGEESPDKLRAELVQLAAVAVAWIECLDRRTASQRAEAAGAT